MSLIQTLRKYSMLPREISEFEFNYLTRLNKMALVFFYCHIPILMAVAWISNTGPIDAVILSLLVLSGPTLAYKMLKEVRWVSVVYGITAMLMGGLLVHFGQGPVQIEMHFYFFALLAMLCMFSNPMVIIAAAVTVALHHLILWFFLPSSVFNYDAPFWVVAVHAAFVVLETVAVCFISRQFFDNVIGLEKIVKKRTLELEQKQREMRLILDNINQGFITTDVQGNMSTQMSAIVKTWFGSPQENQTFSQYIETKAPVFSEWFELGLESLSDGFLPLESCLDQLPKRLKMDHQTLEAQYHVITEAGLVEEENLMKTDASEVKNILIVLSDITAQIAAEQAKSKEQQMMSIFRHMLADKISFLEFIETSDEVIYGINHREFEDLAELKRMIHTIKGNASLFGLIRFSELCHEVESFIVAEEETPSEESLSEIVDEWKDIKAHLAKFLGNMKNNNVEIIRQDFDEVLELLSKESASKEEAFSTMKSWLLEPIDHRLEHIKQHAISLGQRLGKTNFDVEVNMSDKIIRLDSERWKNFWASTTHLVRNAIDHGLDTEEYRLNHAKPKRALICVKAEVTEQNFIFSFKDDGKGIDWGKIRKRAAEMDLTMPSNAEESFDYLLFTEGLSSKKNVTQISGRGVGMGALKQATEDLGGTIDVISTLNHGTEFKFTFPLNETVYKKAS